MAQRPFVERPFVDRPIDDIDAAWRLARRAAAELGAPEPHLIRVGMNAIFGAGQIVIRIGRPSAPAGLALELAERVRRAGVRVPRPASDDVVADGDLSATCWEALRPTDMPTDWHAVGEMVGRVHELDPSELPGGYPLPHPASFPWWDFAALLDDVAGEIHDRALDGLRRAVERNAGWSDFAGVTTVVCHGDVHPGNVIMTDDGPVLLDWDLMCTAPPGWDHAMLLTLAERWGGDPAVYPAFAAGYGRSLADDPVTRRFAELRNVAATLMRVRAGRTDPAARREAERRLRYWRGDPDAPTWQAQ